MPPRAQVYNLVVVLAAVLSVWLSATARAQSPAVPSVLDLLVAGEWTGEGGTLTFFADGRILLRRNLGSRAQGTFRFVPPARLEGVLDGERFILRISHISLRELRTQRLDLSNAGSRRYVRVVPPNSPWADVRYDDGQLRASPAVAPGLAPAEPTASSPCPRAATDGWLTQGECEFFAAFGADVQINNHRVSRRQDFGPLPEIARRAPNPLRQRIEAFVRTLEKGQPSPEDTAREEALMQRLMMSMVFRMDATPQELGTAFMNDRNAVEVWRLQRQRVEKFMASRAESDAVLAQMTMDLERRLGRPASRRSLDLTIALVGQRLGFVGTAGSSAVTLPLLQFTIYPKSPPGKGALDQAATNVGLLTMMGVQIKPPAGSEGARLAIAQDKLNKQPFQRIVLLPSVEAGGRVSIVLAGAHNIPFTEKIEMRIWSGEGWSPVGVVPGLEDAVRALGERSGR